MLSRFEANQQERRQKVTSEAGWSKQLCVVLDDDDSSPSKCSQDEGALKEDPRQQESPLKQEAEVKQEAALKQEAEVIQEAPLKPETQVKEEEQPRSVDSALPLQQPYPVAIYPNQRRRMTPEEINAARWHIALEELEKRNLVLPNEYYTQMSFPKLPPESNSNPQCTSTPKSVSPKVQSTSQGQDTPGTPKGLPPISQFSKMKLGGSRGTPQQPTPEQRPVHSNIPPQGSRLTLEEHAKLVGHDSTSGRQKVSDVDGDGFTHLSEHQVYGNAPSKGDMSPIKKEDDELLDAEMGFASAGNKLFAGGALKREAISNDAELDDDDDSEDDDDDFDNDNDYGNDGDFGSGIYAGGDFDDTFGSMTDMLQPQLGDGSSSRYMSAQSLLQPPNTITDNNDGDIASSLKATKALPESTEATVVKVKQGYVKIDPKNPLTQRKPNKGGNKPATVVPTASDDKVKAAAKSKGTAVQMPSGKEPVKGQPKGQATAVRMHSANDIAKGNI